MSSYSTDSSRTSSPTPSESSSFLSSSSGRSRGDFRLVPCELHEADAIVLVKESVDSSYGKALLLVGPAAQPYRQPSPRRITRESWVHPYKIVPSKSLSRRVSLCLSSLNSVESAA
ncbi:hypothetical protein AGABI1DRAFT_131036 [Agaricus bisporus var. burnettii JB137-S8]|uniref:Uncharacterized protein n=1 Tax=Agaricus bisporus var. burnettii (strain JB137-S8 / ATCC MYA-4627 / FGSC 10392) TaxID=597362 RepID=K5X0V0_AGABU|nr:uncharacterized protein AGABI1DRAFT_131036 [Agaricus bisporus var. burnettii JB137-S8]EKM76743.1 hypothetical protein AGABI1DRAFT_131036 [Agaricus bisporus var. burnettii JB137-S8]